MVHMTDWFPTLLAAAGLEGRGHLAPTLPLDGVNVLPVLRGEPGQVETRRFWQWNRYQPDITSNAAMRDGDWKLVRPAIREAMAVPDIQWLPVSMYGPEHFIHNGIFRPPYPPREVPPPPPPELVQHRRGPARTAEPGGSVPGADAQDAAGAGDLVRGCGSGASDDR